MTKVSVLLMTSCLVLGSADPTGLKLFQVIFRHGHRAPSRGIRDLYPLDPYVNETWYPEGWNGLSNRGKISAYQLGLFFRERYGEWLGDVYSDDNVKFRSSPPPRVIMSTQLVAAGLFPPSVIERWHPELNWQPIPISMEPFNNVHIFSLCKHMCPKHKAMRREIEERDDFLRRRFEALSEFFQFLKRKVGAKYIGHKEADSIYHQLESELYRNVTLPEWTEGIFPEGILGEIAAYDYVIQSYNRTMVQMNGGPWIRDWLKNVDDYLNRSRSGDHHRSYFYGAHEANIAAILIALGVFEPHVPFFNSAMIFELSEVEEKFYVKVLYRNRDVLQELIIPNCGNVNCPLDRFRELFADIVVEDPEALCGGGSASSQIKERCGDR